MGGKKKPPYESEYAVIRDAVERLKAAGVTTGNPAYFADMLLEAMGFNYETQQIAQREIGRALVAIADRITEDEATFRRGYQHGRAQAEMLAGNE